MARYETRSIQVSPDSEQYTINLWAKFGWSLSSSQEIFNQDSHLENRGGDIYNVTKTTNYVKLVFKRNVDMPYYNEVCKLENQYHALAKSEPQLEKHGCLFKILLFVVALCLGYYIMTKSDSEYLTLAIIATVVSVALLAFYIFKRKKSYDEYQKAHPIWEKKCSDILSAVKKYV